MKAGFAFQIFARQAAEEPARTAVLQNGERWTYGELNQRANHLAEELRRIGTGPDVIVAILIERSIERMIAVLATMKAGGAYLPLSAEDPPARLKDLLADAGAEICLVQAGFENRIPSKTARLLVDAKIELEKEYPDPPLYNKADDLAYVIYTSGSTGKPKGVMIEHRALHNRLKWMQAAYPIGHGDIILHKTPFHFDVSVWELFWWAYGGAAVALLPPKMESIPMALIMAVQSQQATILHFVPSMFNVFLNYVESMDRSSELKSLKRVFCSGEALQTHHVEAFERTLARNGTQLTNLYGPTEAAIDATYFDIPPGESPNPIPIGRAIEGMETLVVKEGKIVADGEEGELCLLGIGLARGYLNRPELTEERFCPAPGSPGKRMYRTGDLVRRDVNGNLLYLGREDEQVKVRGIRIELGEIEAVIRNEPEIKDCKLLARKISESITLLVAYVVLQGGESLPDLKARLLQRLPAYMVPNEFVEIPALPLKANGKIDKKALPEVEILEQGKGDAH